VTEAQNQNVRSESFLNTKRWFRKHPELGQPGIISTDLFVSDEQFELERKLLWPHVWIMVGRTEMIAKPGNYFVKEIPSNDVSLIVVRGRDGAIRTFHNVCPHRGSQLCFNDSGTGATTGAFVCPYHGFSFSLDGRLRFVPDEDNFYNLNKEKMGLRPVVTDVWEGFIFVHLDPNPRESLRDYLGEIVDGLEGYPFHQSPYMHKYRAVIDCNWKVLIAGFLEAYHAQALHERSVSRLTSKENPYCHTHFIKLFDKHRMFSFYNNPEVQPTKLGAIAYARHDKAMQQAKASAADSGADESSDTFKRLNSTYYIRNIFPNFQLNLVRGSWFCHQFWPLAVDKVLWDVQMFYPKPVNASEAFFQDYSRYTSRDNLSEDGNTSERTQMGLRAGLLDHWILQDEEIAIQHFNKVVADYTRRYAQGAMMAAK
jgi:phenylpropionate dioxygenase-like ring-hydroxylating dioxygenase large terminal subunit